MTIFSSISNLPAWMTQIMQIGQRDTKKKFKFNSLNLLMLSLVTAISII